MEFWGIEAKGKESSKVKIEEGHLLHLSQAVLGELKKDGEPVTLYVKVDDKKLVLGVLSPDTNPQLSFDLVFEKDFEISHNSKSGSVHLLGYMSEIPHDDAIFSGPSDEDDDEDLPFPLKENVEAAFKIAVPKAIAAKPTKGDKSKMEAKPEDDDDDSDDDEDSDDEESDEDMVDMSDDTDDDDEDDDEESSEEEETPAKVESGKKRKPEAKTPEPKKAKLATPQKTDGKKSVHTATPHPAKKGGKTPPGVDKSTPKSGAQVSGGPGKKAKGKHSGRK